MHEPAQPPNSQIREEWIWGWDTTPGIVSLWVEPQGKVHLWRRLQHSAPVIYEQTHFRPWALLPALDDLAHLGARLQAADATGKSDAEFAFVRLHGPGALRYLVSARDASQLSRAICSGASKRLRRPIAHITDLNHDASLDDCLWLPLEEQYLISTGRTCFRDIAFDTPVRLQLDIETTGLDPRRDRVFLIALRADAGGSGAGGPHGPIRRVIDSGLDGKNPDAAELDLLRRLMEVIREIDPDIIENHNLLGFDLPFLASRARILGLPLRLGRLPLALEPPADNGIGTADQDNSADASELPPGEGPRRAPDNPTAPDHPAAPDLPAGVGVRFRERHWRPRIPGREMIDTLTMVRRYDFVMRDLPSHRLKEVARYFGLTPPDRVEIPGAEIATVWKQDPDRVRRYALADVEETAGLARILGGPTFTLTQMAPRRYERVAEAGQATGILDPLLLRAYLRAGEAVPGFATGDGTQHSGAALHLFATGVAYRVIKADVSSLYPSIMRHYRIGPATDHLGVMLTLIDVLVEQRLGIKAQLRNAQTDARRYEAESEQREAGWQSDSDGEQVGNPAPSGALSAMSAALKILVNSAYGYCGAVGLTRFADVHAANAITRHGREVLRHLCQEFAARGATLIEADTDGVFLAVPEDWHEADERRLVADVATTLPELIKLEYEGRYAAMFSHEPKNYVLQNYNGSILLRGVAFRSSRMEPFGQRFLREACEALLRGDILAIRSLIDTTEAAIRAHTWPATEFAITTRVKKTADRYLQQRHHRREGAYEALLNAQSPGTTSDQTSRWLPGTTIRYYHATSGYALVRDTMPTYDYEVAYYLRLLRTTYIARLARAFHPEDFATLTAPRGQPTLFEQPIGAIRPILRIIPWEQAAKSDESGGLELLPR